MFKALSIVYNYSSIASMMNIMLYSNELNIQLLIIETIFIVSSSLTRVTNYPTINIIESDIKF